MLTKHNTRIRGAAALRVAAIATAAAAADMKPKATVPLLPTDEAFYTDDDDDSTPPKIGSAH
jgi:hypothetical protein